MSLVDHVALGAALYFDHDLSADPTPLVRLLEQLFGESEPSSSLVQWFHRVDNQRATPGTTYELSALERKLRRGETSTATVETPPKTLESDQVMVLAHTTPSARLPVPLEQAWRYDLVIAAGPSWLERLTPSRVVEAVIAFADAVVANAGVILWSRSPRFASDLAWAIGGSSELDSEQRARVSDEMYWRSQWGRVIRGPSWGTFLGAAHVRTLGGIEQIAREAGAADIVSLGSGGAFLQATPIDKPVLEEDVGTEPFARLARVLQPVAGRRA
ncbi:MAG: hypothetical protein ABJE66_05050 [Deltaproteobacteria bacterium]